MFSLISVSLFRELQAQDTQRWRTEIISNLLPYILYRYLAFIQPHISNSRFENLILTFVGIIQIRIRMFYLVRENDMYMTSIRLCGKNTTMWVGAISIVESCLVCRRLVFFLILSKYYKCFLYWITNLSVLTFSHDIPHLLSKIIFFTLKHQYYFHWFIFIFVCSVIPCILTHSMEQSPYWEAKWFCS
jgi:hypothetical protein